MKLRDLNQGRPTRMVDNANNNDAIAHDAISSTLTPCHHLKVVWVI